VVVERTLLDNIKAGGYPGYVIILLALVGVGLVVAYAIIVRRGALLPPLLVSRLEQKLNSGDVEGARELCVRATALRNVLFAGLARIDDGPQAAACAAHLAAERERLALKRYTGWSLLLTIVMVLVGMAGTLGLYVKFYTLFVLMRGTVNFPDLCDSYIVALSPGFISLCFALLLFPAWWFFSGRARMLAHEIEMTADDLIARVAGASPCKDRPTTETLETT